MTTLGSKTWGSAPEIKITFAYEKQRSGADMQYRTKVTVAAVTGSSYFGYPIYLKLTIGGVKRVTKTLKSASPSQWSSAITYTSAWYTVEDKTSGTTPVSFNIYSGSGSSRNSTYTYSMEVDPGSSEITVGNGTLGTAQTISVTRYDTSFTHTITYECGTASGTICEKSEAESISFKPPLSLASQNVTGTSVSVIFKINTYSGTTAVGEAVEKTVTMAIPASVKPEGEIKVSDPTGYADTFGGFVQGRSKMEISVSATLAYGSAIQSKKIIADGKTYTKDSTTPVIASGNNLTISATVTDGRKRTSDTATKPVTVLPYTPPVISLLSVHRCDSDGTENITGSYAKVTYSFAITSLSNKNAKVITLYYKKSSASSYTPVTLQSAYSATSATYIFAADDGSSYDVELSVYDTFTASAPIKKTTSVSTADCLMHWRADGTGIAFGKVSEKANAYEFGKDVYINGQQVRTKRCRVGYNDSSNEKFWFKFASNELSGANVDGRISFKVTFSFGYNTKFGILSVNARTSDNNAYQMMVFECDTGIDSSKFVMAYTGTETNYKYELWVKLQAWEYCYFEVLSESSRTSYVNNWTLYDWATTGYAAEPTSGYTQITATKPYLLNSYPVGSYYISGNSTSPASLFGGTWHRIESRFLWAAPSTSTLGATAGEMTHTLTVKEMPSHTHDFIRQTGQAASGTARATANTSGTALAGVISYTGGGEAHNNMPPYVTVAIWRREA